MCATQELKIGNTPIVPCRGTQEELHRLKGKASALSTTRLVCMDFHLISAETHTLRNLYCRKIQRETVDYL